MYRLYCRGFQQVMRVAMPFLPWRVPELLIGEDSMLKLPRAIQERGLHHVLIVTDRGIVASGLMDRLLDGLQEGEVGFSIYDGTVPNPTTDNIEEALRIYQSERCDGIVAVGGGSPIDCAKGVGARLARPSKSIGQMKGLLKVRSAMPPLFTIPTTAGTGSEATLACVVSNSKTHEKYALMDPALIPHVAVLDPLLTVNLPPHLTAQTGMDALTHAVEAFIGKSGTAQTKQWSIETVKLVFSSLYTAYSDGSDIHARTDMQQAAYLGGMAFTRAYVGNIHAIAHTLSGFYNVPHGLANAIVMPIVLDYYGEAVHKPLAELAEAAGLASASDTDGQKAKKFIRAIRELNGRMGIPSRVEGIMERDIPLMAERALQEANPLYPVPVIFSKKDMISLLTTLRV